MVRIEFVENRKATRRKMMARARREEKKVSDINITIITQSRFKRLNV